MSRLLWASAAAVAVIGSMLIPGGAAAALPPAPTIGTGSIGIANGFENSDMVAINAMGVGSVRIDIDWWALQPTSATTWDVAARTALDQKIDAAYNAGLEVLGVLTYAPPWATGAEPAAQLNHPYPMAAKNGDFRNFAYAMALRYMGKGNITWDSATGVATYHP